MWLSIKINIKLELSDTEFHDPNRKFWDMGINMNYYQHLLQRCIIKSFIVKLLKFESIVQR